MYHVYVAYVVLYVSCSSSLDSSSCSNYCSCNDCCWMLAVAAAAELLPFHHLVVCLSSPSPSRKTVTFGRLW
jgi:hypothetical protein